MAYPIQKFHITSPHDGLKLSCFSIEPENPRAVLQMTHGMQEYKERYLELAQYLADKGFLVVMHDHRGHGKSVRTKDDLGYLYAGGAEGIVTDLQAVTAYCRDRFPHLPLFLFAHSMGTLVARCALKKDDTPYAGVILCGSPSKNPAAGAGLVLVRILSFFLGDHNRNRFCSKIFSGVLNKRFAHEGKNAWVCSDAAVLAKYNADPLCNYTFTLNGYRALMTLMLTTYSPRGWVVENPDLPIRFIAGEDDPCITNEGSFLQAVGHMQRLGYNAVTSRLFPQMRHEIHNEAERSRVYHDMEKTLCGWLKLAEDAKKENFS